MNKKIKSARELLAASLLPYPAVFILGILLERIVHLRISAIFIFPALSVILFLIQCMYIDRDSLKPALIMRCARNALAWGTLSFAVTFLPFWAGKPYVVISKLSVWLLLSLWTFFSTRKVIRTFDEAQRAFVKS